MDKKIYTALGLMSGTSLDGVDAAILRTDGERIFGFGSSLSKSYFSDQGKVVDKRARFIAQVTNVCAEEWRFEGPVPPSVFKAAKMVDELHAEAIDMIEMEEVDLIGYHGQTVMHVPAVNGQNGQTLQLGNGQVLADEFDIPCVYDFRTADVEAGGQGAPLAPIYHKALVEYSNLDGVTAVLNLGGVANVTLVGPDCLKATDTGPGNGPLDKWMNWGGQASDINGSFSKRGVVDFSKVYDRIELNAFFSRPFPRSADRYDFTVDPFEEISLEDGAATLCAFTALSVKISLSQMGETPDRLIVCGGGRHNKTIMTMLSIELDCPIFTAEQVGWNSDMIEAQAFAYLAVRSMLGLPISFPDTTGVPEPMTGGRIAYPASSKRG